MVAMQLGIKRQSFKQSTMLDRDSAPSSGRSAIELIGKLRSGNDYFDELPFANEIANGLENAAISMIDKGMPLDELETISESIESWQSQSGRQLVHATELAIAAEFSNVRSIVADIDSESTLRDHANTLQKLARWADVPSGVIKTAFTVIEDRISELDAQTPEVDGPSVSTATSTDDDNFDDASVKNLFASLVNQ